MATDDIDLDAPPDWPAWALAAAEHEPPSPWLPPDSDLERGADQAQTAYERTFLGWSDQPTNQEP